MLRKIENSHSKACGFTLRYDYFLFFFPIMSTMLRNLKSSSQSKTSKVIGQDR